MFSDCFSKTMLDNGAATLVIQHFFKLRALLHGGKLIDEFQQ